MCAEICRKAAAGESTETHLSRRKQTPIERRAGDDVEVDPTKEEESKRRVAERERLLKEMDSECTAKRRRSAASRRLSRQRRREFAGWRLRSQLT